MGVRVKICGVSNAADAEAVAALNPDFMGFIFWPGSKRFVKPGAVAEWAKNLPPVPRVGVFVDATPDEVRDAVETAGLSVAQLHGAEGVERYQDVAPALWKVVKIDPAGPGIPAFGNAGIAAFQSLEVSPLVGALLLDTFNVASPGGTGATGDWDVARDMVAASRKPVLLAGGLTPGNVGEAIRIVRPWGVDVSSGVEERPARKDMSKVREFIHAARNH